MTNNLAKYQQKTVFYDMIPMYIDNNQFTFTVILQILHYWLVMSTSLDVEQTGTRTVVKFGSVLLDVSVMSNHTELERVSNWKDKQFSQPKLLFFKLLLFSYFYNNSCLPWDTSREIFKNFVLNL